MLDVIPTRLDRIQLRRMRRKVFKIKPARMFVVEKCRRRIMSGKIVPNEDHLRTVIMMHLRQEKDEVLETRRSLENTETKFEKVAARRPGDVTDSRVIVPTGGFEKKGRLTDGRPSVNAVRNERETAFVPQNQDVTVVVGFFLRRGQT